MKLSSLPYNHLMTNAADKDMSMKVEEGGYKGDEGEKRQRTQGCARLVIVTYFR